MIQPPILTILMYNYLTTTGSFSLGSPLSGKWTAITIMEPRVVPTYKQAFKWNSFFVGKESTKLAEQTPSLEII